MRIFVLHTNEGKEYVRSTPERMRAAMREYIKEKLAQGKRLSEIEFTWAELYISKTV